MRTLQKGLILSALSLAAIGCSSDSNTTVDTPAIVGTWTGTAIVATNKANPAQTGDVYAAGIRITLVVNANKTFTQTIVQPGAPNDVASGTWSTTGTALALTVTSAPPAFTLTLQYSITGNTLTFTRSDSDAVWNFGSGPVPANLTVTATRS